MIMQNLNIRIILVTSDNSKGLSQKEWGEKELIYLLN
jgi:hypothetical protein